MLNLSSQSFAAMTRSIRLTEFTATIEEKRAQLEGYVRDGQKALLTSPDCIRCETFADVDDPRKIVALEVWTGPKARSEVARAIPTAAVQGAMSLMASPPLSRNLTDTTAPVDGNGQLQHASLSVALIIASVRQERMGPVIAKWFLSILSGDSRFTVHIIDLADIDLPPALPADPGDLSIIAKRPAQLQATSATLKEADAMIVITPEYNHGLPGSIKHFIDWHFAEWQDKPVAAIGYGGLGGGIRAIENLRVVMAELRATVIRDSITFNRPWELFAEDGALMAPSEHTTAAGVLLNRLAWWAGTLRHGRRFIAHAVGP
jgi:NAD(P)H-dependent FMN reductase